MKHKKVIYIILVFLLPQLTSAQTRWMTSFGRPDRNEGLSFATQSYDKGYTLSGLFYNDASIIVKTSNNGVKLWEKVIKDGSSIIHIWQHSEIKSGRTILAGRSADDPIIASLDACGKLEWCGRIHNSQVFLGGGFNNVVMFEEGNALAMGYLATSDSVLRVFMFKFDPNGELLWYKSYANVEDHPDLFYPVPNNLDTIDGNFFITGDCYYRLKNNPDVFALRPMFIKIDKEYNEEWLLPYGHNIDTYEFLGLARGVLKDSDSIYKGYGRYWGELGLIGVLMNMDSTGMETDYIDIPNQLLNDSINANLINRMFSINDSIYIASANFNFDNSEVAIGEYHVSKKGNVYGFQYHNNTHIGFHPVTKVNSTQFLFVGSIKKGTSMDMLLYKLNADLSSATPVVDTFNYDYLCDDLPIKSDTIDLSACGIITSTAEIPTPEAYYAGLKTISMKVSPNPVKTLLHLKVGDNNQQATVQLRFYHSSGQLVHEQLTRSGNKQIEIDVSSWQKGIYIVIATDDTGKKGSVKFIVK